LIPAGPKLCWVAGPPPISWTAPGLLHQRVGGHRCVVGPSSGLPPIVVRVGVPVPFDGPPSGRLLLDRTARTGRPRTAPAFERALLLGTRLARLLAPRCNCRSCRSCRAVCRVLCAGLARRALALPRVVGGQRVDVTRLHGERVRSRFTGGDAGLAGRRKLLAAVGAFQVRRPHVHGAGRTNRPDNGHVHGSAPRVAVVVSMIVE